MPNEHVEHKEMGGRLARDQLKMKLPEFAARTARQTSGDKPPALLLCLYSDILFAGLTSRAVETVKGCLENIALPMISPPSP